MPFGSFSTLCAVSPLPLCSLLGPLSTLTTPPTPLLQTACVARSIEVANTIIFQAASDFAHILALGMTAIMILHVRSKFTAVGRKEILTFFYVYMTLTIVSLVLDAGVLEARSGGAYPWFVAVQNGLTSALCISLLVNGFVGFQLYEDGTILSVWLLRISSLGIFVISFAVSLLTFKSWAGLSPTNTTGLFVVLYLINGIALLVYVVMQILLVTNTLQDRWPLGDLAFGVFFFVIGQVILYVFGTRICEGVSHYLDGVFFATVCNLLAVMMVYKYWDSITREDLEFSVGTRVGLGAGWGVVDAKEPLMGGDPNEDRRGSVFDMSGAVTRDSGIAGGRGSTYDLNNPIEATQGHQNTRSSSYGPVAGQSHSRSQSFGPVSRREQSHSRGQSREGGGQQGLLEGPQQRNSMFDSAPDRRSRYGESVEAGRRESHRRSRFDDDDGY